MTKEVKGKKLTIVGRALKRLNLSEDDKLVLMYDFKIRDYEKQIKLRKRQLFQKKEKFEETLEEYTEVLNELEDEKIAAFETIDVESIGSVAARKSYSDTFDNQIADAEYRLKRQEDKIETLKSEYNKEVESIEKEIKIYQDRLDIIVGE